MSKLDNIFKAWGAMSEVSLVIYRSVLNAGGSRNEARQIVSAYLLATFSNDSEAPRNQ